jgi:hypothetical protein
MTKNKYLLAALALLVVGLAAFYGGGAYQTAHLVKANENIQRWNLWGSYATCVSAAVAAVAAGIAAWSFHIQVQQSKTTLGVDVLLKLDNDFGSPRMLAKRARAATALKDQPGKGNSDINGVLDFFEGVALFERRGVIETEFVWHSFYEWFSTYYYLTQAYRAEERKRDHTVWLDLDGLYERVSLFQGADQPRHPTPAEVTEFLNDEIALVD